MDKKDKIILAKKLKKLVIKYSWEILEMKYAYYHGAECSLKAPSDAYYDNIEAKYKKYCKMLKIEPTASNNVGFPSHTPSGRLVISKYNK